MEEIYASWNRNQQPQNQAEFDKIKQVGKWWHPNLTDEHLENDVALHVHSFRSDDLHEKWPHCRITTEAHGTIVASVQLHNRDDIISQLNVNPNLTDEQLILKLYLKHGQDCTQFLIGSFSFAIWDKSEDLFFIARDHIGVKPLYYYIKNGRFIFSTTRKLILANADINKEIDWNFQVQRMQRKHNVENRTINKHIKILLPAHSMVITRSSVKTSRYWRLNINKSTVYSSTSEYVEHFLELFKQAIEDRMHGIKNIGSHLSGGLDSSGISAVAQEIARKSGRKLSTYSYVFPDKIQGKLNPKYFNFNPLVLDQIRHSGIDKPQLISSLVERSGREMFEYEINVCSGVSWSNNINTEYEIQHLAQKQHVGAILSGFPGDEMVTSFCRSHYLEYLERNDLVKFFTSKHGNKNIYPAKVFLLLLKILSSVGVKVNNKKLAAFYERNKSRIFYY